MRKLIHHAPAAVVHRQSGPSTKASGDKAPSGGAHRETRCARDCVRETRCSACSACAPVGLCGGALLPALRAREWATGRSLAAGPSALRGRP